MTKMLSIILERPPTPDHGRYTLEIHAQCHESDQGTDYEIQGVNHLDGTPIIEEQLPNIQQVKEALNLYFWAHRNPDLFTCGRVTNEVGT